MSLEGHLDATVTDGAVEFSFAVTNTAPDPVELEFRSGLIVDVTVTEDGDVVWRWSEERMFTQAIETETLAPGSSLLHEARWDDPPAGEYVAEASLEAVDSDLVERTAFEVA